LSAERALTTGVCDGSGSGKTTFTTLLQQRLGPRRCLLLQQDAYYRDCGQRFDRDGGSVNLDHPDAIDFGLLVEQLAELKARKPAPVPVYDFRSHRRLNTAQTQQARPIIVLEGMLILPHEGGETPWTSGFS
jgi:uridine kinase